MTDASKCALASIGGCSKKRIEVHHRDGNPTNNAPENRVPLCPSHHKLVEYGRINLDAPSMPKFVVSGGKRRYAYAYPWVG
jgi:hypothetical protein